MEAAEVCDVVLSLWDGSDALLKSFDVVSLSKRFLWSTLALASKLEAAVALKGLEEAFELSGCAVSLLGKATDFDVST